MLRTNTMQVSSAIRSYHSNETSRWRINSEKIRRHPIGTDEKQSKQDRERIVQILEARLRTTTKINQDQAGISSNDAISKIARRLEQLLFESSSTHASHCDLSTLDDRLRLLLTVQTIQRRCLKKTSSKGSNNINKKALLLSSSSSSEKYRSQQLRKVLGKEKYFHVKKLVHEIKLAKNNKVATMKCCATTGICSRPFGSNLPKAVSDLFFHTSLVDAFDRLPLGTCDESYHNKRKICWDDLIATAENNLRAYNKWSGIGN